jgi:hypothetical protein
MMPICMAIIRSPFTVCEDVAEKPKAAVCAPLTQQDMIDQLADRGCI